MEGLLDAKRNYDDPPVPQPQKEIVKTATEGNGDKWESRVDKLERTLLSAIEKNKPQSSSIKVNTQIDQVDDHPNTTGFWNANRSLNPGRQDGVCCGGYSSYKWEDGNPSQPHQSWSRRNQPDPYPPTPYATHAPVYQEGHRIHTYHFSQQHPDFSDPDYNQHEPPDHFTRHPSRPNQPNQHTNFQPYRNQFYPSRNQCHPHHQHEFDRTLNISQHANSIEKKIEGLIVSQQNMRSCLKTNDELTLELQHAHDEHKASMNEMIRQASQIADAVKEVQENKARILLKKLELDKAGESKLTGEVDTLNTEPATRKLPERYEEARNVERTMAEKESQPEAELFAIFQNDEP